jgi:hypothetical protein
MQAALAIVGLPCAVKGEFTQHCAFGYRASWCSSTPLRSAKIISSFSISSAIIEIRRPFERGLSV